MGAKRDLYGFISQLKNTYEIEDVLRCSAKRICEEKFNFLVGEMNFKTHGLRGMATPSTGSHPPVILLNNKRSRTEQNFDGIHEAIHLLKHSDSHKGAKFSCYDKVRPNQNPYIEWEANEGAAEFLMPYKKFIPALQTAIFQFNFSGWTTDDDPITRMARYFGVTEVMIKNRIKGLQYEILQHFSGIELCNLDIKSKREQLRYEINASNYRISDIYSNYLNSYF